MKKQRTADVFKPATETAVVVVPGELKIERKEKKEKKQDPDRAPGQVGDIFETAYYERKHTGKTPDTIEFTDWVRTGTRFYRVDEVFTSGNGDIAFGLEAMNEYEGYSSSAAAKFVAETADLFFMHHGIRFDRKYTESNGRLWQPWVHVWAQEFEAWHLRDAEKQHQLTPTQLNALSPKRLPWPVTDIVLGYSNRKFEDVGFPRKPMRYDASGPIPRLIGSLG